MARIRLLPEHIASQVAAGEVVERPASVVKELVENSLDAGASNIEIATQRGGISLIRVIDDGHGMNRDDALMCLERNATSKIRTADDLAAIDTLGFRGEAIPSIASVSRFRLATRERDALSGTEVIVNGGRLVSVNDCGDPPGTTVEVRSLFSNVPARRKFLRTENTEFSHLEQVVRTQALGHEAVRFTLMRGDRTVFQLPPASHLRERIAGLAGTDLAGRLLEVEPFEHAGIEVRGFIGPPGMGRSDRRQMWTFINGRPVEAAMITRALREGYHTALMKGQYPVTFLFLTSDPAAVDVNVHPAKREVRFRDGYAVRDAIVEAVRRTLRERMRRPVAGVGLTGADRENPPPRPVAVEQPDLLPRAEQHHLRRDWHAAPGGGPPIPAQPASPPSAPPLPDSPGRSPAEEDTAPGSDDASPAPSPEEVDVAAAPAGGRSESAAAPEEASPPRAEDYRLLGVLGKLYVLLESAEGLVLMDQHAAHERVLFEQMKASMEEEGVPSQGLLAPLTIELGPRDFDLVSRNTDTLAKLGFVAEPFGGHTLKIDGLPAFFRSDDPESFLQELIDELRVASDRTSALRLGEDMVATTVCRHAVKANDPLHAEELQRLLADLLACDMPYCCPHGRPTLIQISYAELDRKFGRRT